MKYFIIVCLILMLLCVGILSVYFVENEKYKELQSKTIEGLRERADSLTNVTRLQSDTIRIAKNTIILQADTIKNDKQAKENYKRDTHNKIRFIQFDNDSLRTAEIKKLYSSWK